MRGLMGRLDTEMAALFRSLRFMVSRQLRQEAAEAGREMNPFDDAKEHHAEAARLTDAILTELHGRGNTGATSSTETDRDEPTFAEAS